METLLNLVRDDDENANVLCVCVLICNQIDEDSVSDMLSSLNAEKHSYEYRINMLEALRQVMNESNTAAMNTKNSWHELGGFATVLSLSASLDSLWPECDEQLSQLGMDLIEKSFVLILAVIANHPKNRAHFWHSSWNSIADAMIVTGVLKSSHSTKLFQILFDLAIEESSEDGDRPFAANAVQITTKKEEDEKTHVESHEEKKQSMEAYKPRIIKNPEAILVILKLASLCSEQAQLQVFEKLLSLINLYIIDDNGEKRLLLRNKQLLTDQGTIQHVFDLYAQVFESPSKSSLRRVLNQFIVELGTHRLSPSELNTLLTWARENNSRYYSIMQFLSGEHKFPFFEFECFSQRVACIKMAGRSHFSIVPERGFSLSFWFNLRSASKASPELTLCTILKDSSSVNIMELRYHCGNGSIIIKLANQETSNYLICSDVHFEFNRWYHITVTFQLSSIAMVANVKSKNKQSFDVLLYLNGAKYRQFHETLLLKTNTERIGKKKKKNNGGSTKGGKKKFKKRNKRESSVASQNATFKLDEAISHKIMYGPILQSTDCKLIIGVDSRHLQKPERNGTTLPIVWWIGPVLVFNGVLSTKQVTTIVDAGTDYTGTFHSSRAVNYIQEREEKISHYPNRIDPFPPVACSFHPQSHYSFAEARNILQSNSENLEIQELSPYLMEANVSDVSLLQEIVNVAGLRAPGGILKNTSHPVNTVVISQGPYAYLSGGVSSIRPLALEDSIRYVGGIE
ncbi:hypothetical protein RFI_24408, partial [Reticulomyxa filosa]